MSNQQFFLLIKNFAYDIHALRHFYSWADTTVAYSAPSILPTFFAISAPCAKSSNVLENFQCYKYNINSITVENRGTLGLTSCSSIDNTIQAQDALAHTVRINNDVYLFHKNCIVAKHVTLPTTNNPETVSINAEATNTPSNLQQIVTSGTSSEYKNEALLMALNSISRNMNPTGNTYNVQVFTVIIEDIDVAKFLTLVRPMFIRFGLSSMYAIDYDHTTTSNINGINDYQSTRDLGKLTLKVRKVMDAKIYPTDLIDVKQAHNLVTHSKALDVDCKPKNILDPTDTFLARYNVSLDEEKETETDNNTPMNLMVYYLTHSQIVESSKDVNTRCVSLFIKDIAFTATETKIFEFASHHVVVKIDSGNKLVTLKNFGRGSGSDFMVSIPDTNTSNVSLVITWSENRLTVAGFYFENGGKHIIFKSGSTNTKCNLLKSHFDQACKDQKCTIGPKSNACLISLYDFAKSKGLV